MSKQNTKLRHTYHRGGFTTRKVLQTQTVIVNTIVLVDIASSTAQIQLYGIVCSLLIYLRTSCNTVYNIVPTQEMRAKLNYSAASVLLVPRPRYLVPRPRYSSCRGLGTPRAAASVLFVPPPTCASAPIQILISFLKHITYHSIKYFW